MGHLLPRTIDDIVEHAARFVVAEHDGAVIGCAELAPLSTTVAEVRSLVVDEHARGQRIGPRLVTELASSAAARGFATLCAFTHEPSHFVRLGFSIVPHIWVPEKIAHDCTSCPLFRHCGQYAVTLPLRDGVRIRPEQPAAVIYGGRTWRRAARTSSGCSCTRRTPTTGVARGAGVSDASEPGVTAPLGFRAAGVACGIKKSGLDLALIVSDAAGERGGGVHDQPGAGRAGPRLAPQLEASGGRAAAIVVNSGCANACTGPDGLEHADAMADATAAALACERSGVLVASTGVIGVKLDMAKVGRGIASAARALSREGGPDAARAIMTTDPFPKEVAVEIQSRAGTFRVGGIAKGSGMIEPLMATMLGFVTTDAAVEPALLQRALKAVVDDTFNAITVDGECSTNDCVFALANGASGVSLDETDYAAPRRRAAPGLRAAGDRHRARRRRRDQARHRARDRRGRRTSTRGARRGRSRTRRWSRPRCTAATRTGAGSSRSPDARGWRSCSTPRRCGSGRSSSSATARRSTSARPRRPST